MHLIIILYILVSFYWHYKHAVSIIIILNPVVFSHDCDCIYAHGSTEINYR